MAKTNTEPTPSTLVNGHKMRLITQAKFDVASVRDELKAADESGSANVDVAAAVKKLSHAFEILDDIDGRRKQHLDPSASSNKAGARRR
jgi:hypothetical protein